MGVWVSRWFTSAYVVPSIRSCSCPLQDTASSNFRFTLILQRGGGVRWLLRSSSGSGQETGRGAVRCLQDGIIMAMLQRSRVEKKRLALPGMNDVSTSSTRSAIRYSNPTYPRPPAAPGASEASVAAHACGLMHADALQPQLQGDAMPRSSWRFKHQPRRGLQEQLRGWLWGIPEPAGRHAYENSSVRPWTCNSCVARNHILHGGCGCGQHMSCCCANRILRRLQHQAVATSICIHHDVRGMAYTYRVKYILDCLCHGATANTFGASRSIDQGRAACCVLCAACCVPVRSIRQSYSWD